MSTENFTPAGPGAPQPEVKKTLAFVALALCIVASILMLAGHIITGQQVAAAAIVGQESKKLRSFSTTSWGNSPPSETAS